MTVEHAVASYPSLSGYKVFEDYYDSNKRYVAADGKELARLSEWIAYNTVYESPEVYADDWDAYTSKSIDVHFFTKSNTTANAVKISLRNALRDEGYVIIQTQKTYENDSLYYHVIISIQENSNTEV